MMSQDHRGEYQRQLDDFAFPVYPVLETQLFDDLFSEFSHSQNMRAVPPPPAEDTRSTPPDPHHFPHPDGPYDSPMSHTSISPMYSVSDFREDLSDADSLSSVASSDPEEAIHLLQVAYTHQLLMRDTILDERNSKTESSAEYDARQREMVDELKELMKPAFEALERKSVRLHERSMMKLSLKKLRYDLRFEKLRNVRLRLESGERELKMEEMRHCREKEAQAHKERMMQMEIQKWEIMNAPRVHFTSLQ